MTAAPVGIKSETGKDRFYMNSVAFVIPKLKANVIVSMFVLNFFFMCLSFYLAQKLLNRFVQNFKKSLIWV